MLPRDAQCLLAVELATAAIETSLAWLMRHGLASATMSISLGDAATARLEVAAPPTVDTASADLVAAALAALDGVTGVELYTLHRNTRADRTGQMYGRRLVRTWQDPALPAVERLAA